MTADKRYEHLIDPVIGPESKTVPLGSVDLSKVHGMVQSSEEVFGGVEERVGGVGELARVLEAQVSQVTEGLTSRERRVLQLRFGLTGALHSLRQAGRELGVSHTTVLRDERRAMEKLMRPSHGRILRQYLS